VIAGLNCYLLSNNSEHESVEKSITYIICYSKDPSDWFPFPINNATASFWLEQGPLSCKLESTANNYTSSLGHYKPTKREPKCRTRSFSSRHFYSSAPNTLFSKWLLYSPIRGSVYNFYCTLMNANKDVFSQPDGFSSWRLASKRIKAHEQSACHRDYPHVIHQTKRRCSG